MQIPDFNCSLDLRPQLAVVDLRPLHAYNGWSLNGEARSGHIPGAVALPHSWFVDEDNLALQNLLHSKGVLAGQEVVLYDHDVEGTLSTVERLSDLGYDNVRGHECGWLGWAADQSLPIERLPNYEKLLHVDWLRKFLSGAEVRSAPEGRSLLFHVNFGVPEEYAENHLPGALHLDINLLEDSKDWNRRSPEELDAALRQLGITHDTTVILYGRDTEGNANEKWPGRRAGQIAATRAALILNYCGVDDVRVLDGGYDAWVRASNELETTIRRPAPVAEFGVVVPQRPELIIDIDEAKEVLAAPDSAALVSVRTWDEHIGEVSGYNYIQPRGRIAGDVWGNCGTDAYHMQHYRNEDNTMRPYAEIAENWREAGITPDKRVVFYCGTGWRASETWFYAYLMGWEDIAVYDGGWHEWSQDPESNPIEIGV